MKNSILVTALLTIAMHSVKAQVNDANFQARVYNNLEEAYKVPTQVYKLELAHRHVNTDTLDLSVFSNLQELNLAYDSLFTLPKGLEKLEKLTVLDISANNFTLLPEQIALIPNLQELYLNNEKHLDLAQSFMVINKITHLKRLHLDSIPNFKFPKHIKLNDSVEYLSMRYDGLERIPNELWKFRHLRALDLEGNKIKSIDRNFLKNKEIESLTLGLSPRFKFKRSFSILAKESRLSSLTISNSSIDNLPEDFSVLTNITSLSLRNDHLKTFPSSILKLKNLKNLDLSGNDFNSLPSDFSSLSKLETLDLTNDNFLNFNQTADVIRYLPSLHLVHIHDYDFTFDPDSYVQFKENGRYIELFPSSKKSSTIHMFKKVRPASTVVDNVPFKNFNAEGFGIRLGF